MIKLVKERDRKRINVGGDIPLAAKLHGIHACSSSVFLKP